MSNMTGGLLIADLEDVSIFGRKLADVVDFGEESNTVEIGSFEVSLQTRETGEFIGLLRWNAKNHQAVFVPAEGITA